MIDPFADIFIPVAAILVPTSIAIWLARSERASAEKERKAAAAAQRALDYETQRRRAVEIAMSAMSDVVEAAFTIDLFEETRIRIRAASKLPAIRMDLPADDDPVMGWIGAELGAASAALEDRPLPPAVRLPRHGDQIVWRSGHFVNALTEWISGTRATEWFTDDKPVPIAKTVKPSADS